MGPNRKITKKFTKKFDSKVINRQYFHRKTGLEFSSAVGVLINNNYNENSPIENDPTHCVGMAFLGWLLLAHISS